MTLNGYPLPVALLADAAIQRLDLKRQFLQASRNARVAGRTFGSALPDRNEGLRHEDSVADSLVRDIGELDALVGGGVGLSRCDGGIAQSKQGLPLYQGRDIEPTPAFRGVQLADLKNNVGLAVLDPQIWAKRLKGSPRRGRVDLPDIDRPSASPLVLVIDIEMAAEQRGEQIHGTSVDLLDLEPGLVGDIGGVSNRPDSIGVSVESDMSVGVGNAGTVGKLGRFVHPPEGSTTLGRERGWCQ